MYYILILFISSIIFFCVFIHIKKKTNSDDYVNFCVETENNMKFIYKIHK